MRRESLYQLSPIKCDTKQNGNAISIESYPTFNRHMVGKM
jgi:hypothetical protein